ncbi:unnamed protein product [Nezara viridula]|uniref:Glucose-methanol-choline oxidoreductase N-terminal domain-containing protein n=1 Tax=Nezara viridula TaxID=85310 RepID=A0A9P0DY48_NEZVI|nr:unnamed protein product [Nezara viridula]
MMELNFSAFMSTLFTSVNLYFPESIDPSLKTTDIPQSSISSEYDFIIVGAGSAGSVVANRLTENPNWNVLLIEAGFDGNPISDAPFLSLRTYNTEIDWNYTTIPQKNACLGRDGRCQYPRGRAMGGSSTINAMFYVRGNAADYDGWAALGNPGWSYNDVLPYFIKSENNTEPSLVNSSFHGTNGPQHVQYPNFVSPLRERFVQAAEEFGMQRGDFNGERQDVVGYAQATINGPIRADTARGYLDPIRDRKNLNIIKGSTVTRIIFNNKVAEGVEYYRYGSMYRVSARMEVILSAGSINTPQLLMLSGIGPSDELKRHNIPIVQDLPVGEHLQDHLRLHIYFEINLNDTLTSDVWETTGSIEEYTKDRNGPLTTTGGEAMAFFSTTNSSELPDMQVTWVNHLADIIEPQHRNIITTLLCNVKPFSVGSVKLRSAKWYDPPLIDPNYFSDHRDFESFQRGMEYLFQYMKTPTMSKLEPTLYTEVQPECQGMAVEEFIPCVITHYTATIFHPVSTARMGQEGDAVVNSYLQVYGISKLRVIDASIMPFIVRGNTNAPAIMIGEKGSDIIKAFYKD